MLNIKKIFRLDSSVLCLVRHDRLIIALDNVYTLHIIDSTTLALLKSIPLTKNIEPPHRYSKSFSIATKNEFCIPFVGTKKGIIVEFGQSITKKATIDWHDSDLESSAFSPNGKYLATGGQDGKVFLFEQDTYRLLASLAPRADYISSLVFSSNSELLACCGFDKFTQVFDVNRNKTITVIQTPDVAEECIFFDNDNKIYLVLRNGGSVVYDLWERKTLSNENPFSAWPSVVALTDDERFAIVGTRSELLYVMELPGNSRALEIKTEFAGVASIFIDKECIYVGSVDGSLAVIDHKVGIQELEVSLKVKDYRRARAVIEQNLFLTIHPMMKVFDEDWPAILKDAIALLNENRIDEAVDLTEPFTTDLKKKSEFDFYLMQKNVVANFSEAVKQKEFQKAYDMTLATKFLVKTVAYTELESYWNKSFAQAKKVLEENPGLNIRKAEAILKPFDMTVKKELIAQLLKNSKIFLQADAIIKKRDFKAYFALVQQFAFLKDTDLYKKVITLGERMMDDFNELEKSQKYDEAANMAKHLADFPPFKKSVFEKMIFIQQKQLLLGAIGAGQTKKVYEIVSQYESLKALPQFREFIEDFNVKFESAKLFAYDGDAKRTMLAFGVYSEIGYWQDKIASLLKIAYLKEIEKNVTNKQVNWPITVKRYFDRFGKDTEISRLLEMNKLQAHLEKIEGDGDREGYKRHKFADEIVVYLVGTSS